jgi:hypothetical protein
MTGHYSPDVFPERRRMCLVRDIDPKSQGSPISSHSAHDTIKLFRWGALGLLLISCLVLLEYVVTVPSTVSGSFPFYLRVTAWAGVSAWTVFTLLSIKTVIVTRSRHDDAIFRACFAILAFGVIFAASLFVAILFHGLGTLTF